jgi:hypothetical protein
MFGHWHYLESATHPLSLLLLVPVPKAYLVHHFGFQLHAGPVVCVRVSSDLRRAVRYCSPYGHESIRPHECARFGTGALRVIQLSWCWNPIAHCWDLLAKISPECHPYMCITSLVIHYGHPLATKSSNGGASAAAGHKGLCPAVAELLLLLLLVASG